MERRAFVKGACGLVILAACGGVSTIARMALDSQSAPMVPDASQGMQVLFTTPKTDTASAVGPLMHSGIQLVSDAKGAVVRGRINGVELFKVNELGARLVMLADGSRNIKEIASRAVGTDGNAAHAADVASFFVEMGKAGYLQNEVYVNLYEVPA